MHLDVRESQEQWLANSWNVHCNLSFLGSNHGNQPTLPLDVLFEAFVKF